MYDVICAILFGLRYQALYKLCVHLFGITLVYCYSSTAVQLKTAHFEILPCTPEKHGCRAIGDSTRYYSALGINYLNLLLQSKISNNLVSFPAKPMRSPCKYQCGNYVSRSTMRSMSLNVTG